MASKGSRSPSLRRRALRLDQDPKHPLYVFALTGPELVRLADISRVSRDEAGKLLGYQRPEVKQHIENIVEYLVSGDVLFPNPVILALSSGVEFKEARGPKVDNGQVVAGTLEIPLPNEGEPKPAWIVDGQQRTLALTRSGKQNFVVPVNAFVADDIDLQRDQFLRINSARPLPRGLINELLPEVTTVLPAKLAARKAPSAVCEMLNRDPESPFLGMVRRTSTPKEELGTAVVTDTVLIKMLQDSFSTPSGILFPFRNIAAGSTDFPGVRAVLFAYWRAVKETFPEAWGRPPEKSRLMHGVGIRSMGRLMDRVMASIDVSDSRATARVVRELSVLKPHCAWTSGEWEALGGLQWNQLQNISSHLKMLTNFLMRAYLSERRTHA